jgi:hypothetical protein
VGEGFETINKFKENIYWRKEGDGRHLCDGEYLEYFIET